MAKCLVTGGAGFIGSHVVKHLLDAGHRVVVIDDLSGGNLKNLPYEETAIQGRGDVEQKGFTFYKGDICDPFRLQQIFKIEEPEYVYHLAAYAAEGLSHFIRAFNYKNNVVGSMNVINECVKHDVKCLVFTSSAAVYRDGLHYQDCHNEFDVPEPSDPYGIAKYAVEMDLKCASEMFGLPYIIFRPHNVYGPHQNIFDRYRNVIGIFMNQCLTSQPITIFGEGGQTRCFSYIDEVAKPIAFAPFEAGCGEIYNIGGGVPCSIFALAMTIREMFDMGEICPIEYLPERHEAKTVNVSHARAKKVFAKYMEPSVSLIEGLQKMKDWVSTISLQPSPKFKNIELEKNLPEIWR